MKIGERAYDRKTGRLAQVGLTQQIASLPLLRTPTAAESHDQSCSQQVYLQNQIAALLPTPRAEKQSPQSREDFTPNLAARLQMLPTPATRDYRGANSEERLAQDRGHHNQLPNALAMLPTPSTKDVSGGAVTATQTETGWKRTSKRGVSHGAQLHDVTKTLGEKTGFKLWPEFVEHMMGYLEGFTELPD
ncbi:MAG: hypothetical protein WC350_06195 [Candidatus Micrarchaeia archaeon]